MEILQAHQLSFTYPETTAKALQNINLQVKQGEFVVLCGPSGSGKSTLLRLCKPEIAPHGTLEGRITFQGMPLEELEPMVKAKELGMVFQDPENQIAMDNVMEELIFGMENIGFTTAQMRKKVAEMVNFFGLNYLLDKKTDELSGGQKQLINLASVLLLEPKILLLDEPTSQLDPIAAKEFIHMLQRLNEEFGITIVIVEHRLEELFTIANRVVMLENGAIIHDKTPREMIRKLGTHEKMRNFLPSSSLLYLDFHPDAEPETIPLNVKETRQWLQTESIEQQEEDQTSESEQQPILELREVDYQYTKNSPPVLYNLSLSIYDGEWLAIVGANGTGKTTLLKIIGGILKAQHGTMRFKGKKVKKWDAQKVSYLPQNPKLFFIQDTIKKEYDHLAEHHGIANAEERIQHLLEKFNMKHLQDRHPYDLSGGELQKAALIGTLLVEPAILLIDEPTKGLDPESKKAFGELVSTLVTEGLTVVMVTHDIEFAAAYATRCSMLFQGEITVTEKTRDFFHENTYYTTVMNRVTRNSSVPSVVTLEEARRTWRVQNRS
ncbi:energy-coupling factor transport system ATP-binding protein [Salirhabdus euzebyi]|uniref:Energy-coupling factor transport system ATP-binding protein n=1 Tax=Salirhabdus euzebyi TaxID=394506 RepID=A0A841Q4D9_9BACI|nr:ATP-binding cassette domain-containing protein [Salirhabdus euzebyi]MBB6453200.1 energy-coupling factor transport system ATP-binding protein [Salirhabdus euzebyi]